LLEFVENKVTGRMIEGIRWPIGDIEKKINISYERNTSSFERINIPYKRNTNWYFVRTKYYFVRTN